MTQPQHFDLIILGTGSGNSIPGPDFDDKSIAIVEKGRFGGTCLNVGCIPTKMLVKAADAAVAVREASQLGVHASVDSIDWPSIQQRIFGDRIDPIAQSGEAYRRGDETPNITVFGGTGRFTGTKEVTVSFDDGRDDAVITAETIVIATGAHPQILDVIADSGVPYETNETVMRMPELPQSMIVLGGGFIACEFAHVFSGLGVEVTVINRSERLLKKLDRDISDAFTSIAQRQWNTKLGRTVDAAKVLDNGEVELRLDDGSTVQAETLLVATGRTPNGANLDPEQAGIATDGPRIVVDEFGRTSADGVWALGDVSSPYQLKHVANAETRAVVHNLRHPDDLQPMPHDAVPAAVFTHPEIAWVGMTEQQAVEAGYDTTVFTQQVGDVAYGWALEDSTGMVKLIADRNTGKLLGAHILGPQASTLIHELIIAMAHGLDMRTFARDSYWVHPALSEVVENAVLGLDFAEA
ncbi:mycothione reductase [Corynebacterium choanae]|uniref:Mycothione reductase n=1 Tax=Corynebacterium choanae TaxID=1862358 RepID=A0A3G6JB72_9CORY|nr:mycothione reductase [Corynebacterium choanae]AZA13840.1 Mycothione reductase [Corynebacterium choanae]